MRVMLRARASLMEPFFRARRIVSRVSAAKAGDAEGVSRRTASQCARTVSVPPLATGPLSADAGDPAPIFLSVAAMIGVNTLKNSDSGIPQPRASRSSMNISPVSWFEATTHAA